MSKTISLHYMPWADVRSRLTIGPVEFWPLKEVLDAVHDSNISQFLTRYFNGYQDYKLRPVESVTLCFHGKLSFDEPNAQVLRDIKNAVASLAFASTAPHIQNAIAQQNGTWIPPWSETFHLIDAFVDIENPMRVTRSRGITNALNFDDAHFIKPDSVGGFSGYYDEQLLKGLSKFFSCKVNSNFTRQLFSSIEWFRLANINSDFVSEYSRIVMIATALERILGVEPKTKEFAKSINQKLDIIEPAIDLVYNKTLLECWAYELYELRCGAVHKNQFESLNLVYQNWGHCFIASVVFYQIVKLELFDLGLLGECERNGAHALANICEDKTEQLESDTNFIEKFGKRFLKRSFEDFYEAFGWRLKTKPIAINATITSENEAVL